MMFRHGKRHVEANILRDMQRAALWMWEETEQPRNYWQCRILFELEQRLFADLIP